MSRALCRGVSPCLPQATGRDTQSDLSDLSELQGNGSVPCRSPPGCVHLVQIIYPSCDEMLAMVVQDLMQTGEEPNVGATLERSPTPTFTMLELWQFEAEEDLKVSCAYLTSLPKRHGVTQNIQLLCGH